MSQHTARFVLPETRRAYQSLLERAAQHYRERPEANAVIFVPAGNAPHRPITYRAFFENAARYAETLRGIGIGRHDLAILVMDHSEALLYAFWGALMLGAIPSIFPFLSDRLDPALYFERVRLLISHSGAKVVIASAQYADSLAALNSGVPIVSEAALRPSEGVPQFNFEVRGEDIAFLQHSSGTTGLQKGVALSHGAVLNQIASYSAAIRLNPADCIVSWLPLYHDMGLIAAFVLPLVQGIPLVLISPHHWVRDPKVMLHAISQYRGTLCWMPNFAYNFLAQRVRDDALEGVSLASMRAFINCSEPMRAESHRQFAARYAAYGVRPEMLATCYAMAENTFAVTQGGIDSLPNIDLISREALSTQHIARPAVAGELTVEMLSCGVPIPNCEVQIVDEARQPLPERHVGEVAVRSDSMLSSYYRRPDLTEQALFNGWYLTGDYGYIANGELYITGRKKDLIIVGGKNIYPQDLEAIADKVKGVKPGRTVAFGVEDEQLGTESVVMVCEVETDDEDERFEIARQVRMRVAQEADVTLSDVYIVDPKWLHKTSSGKIARNVNREKYLRERNGRP